jgi:protein-disulfide isomerase
LGAQVPLIIITEFGDFQCQFCRQATGSIRKLIRKYGAPTGDLAYEWRYNPLTSHDKALDWAAATAAAHRQGQFWPMHDHLFHRQSTMTDASLGALAKEIKLDTARWERDRADAHLREHILRDRAIAIALGARGTPAFFVNGRLMLGMQSDKQFEQAIEAERKKAAALLKAGSPRNTVAATLQRKNNPTFAKYLSISPATPIKGDGQSV